MITILCWQESDGVEVPGKRMRGRPKWKWLDNMMWDENKCIVLYVYVGAISRCLVSNEDVPLRVRDHAWRANTETRRQNSAATSRCTPRKASDWR